MGFLVRRDDGSVFSRALFEFVLVQKAGLASGVSHENATFLGALDKALVVTANAIADRHEAKIPGVKNVAVFSSKLQQSFRKTVVVLLLLECVVESGVTKVLLAISNEKLLELWVAFPAELLSINLSDGDSFWNWSL